MIARILLTVGILASHQLAFAATHQTGGSLIVAPESKPGSSEGRLLPSRTRRCESEPWAQRASAASPFRSGCEGSY